MSDKREFTGVFIPAHIWVSKELIPAEKMILGEIDALSKSRGYCDASRKHFAEWLSCTVQNISFYLTKLERLGFIKIEKVPGYRSKIRLINDRFYQDGGVNGIDGGGKRGLRVGVNGIDGGGKRGLPEIQDKRKGLNISLNESSAPANFSKNETDSNFQKIGAIEVNENPVPLKTGKMEQDAPGAGPTQAEIDRIVDEYFYEEAKADLLFMNNYLETTKKKEEIDINGRTEGELEIDAAIDAYFDNVIISEQRRIAESKAIRPDDPNPVETATQIAVRFMQTNPDTVKLWCENARWSGTPQALVNEFREFFSYYQSTGPEHQSITRPEYWFKTRFPGWISKAKNFKNGTTNTNTSPEQLANDSLRRALEYAEQERRRSGEAGY